MSRRGFSTPAIAAPLLLLAALLAGDLIFIGLHLVHVQTDLLPSSRWSIERDRGFGEIFQYLKFAAVCAGLAHLFGRTHMPSLIGWIAVFAYLLLDDAARLHERFGLSVVAFAHVPDFGALRGRDIGELVYALFAAMLVAVPGV